MSTFAVGEIAIIWKSDKPWHGSECAIKTPLVPLIGPDGVERMHYLIDCPAFPFITAAVPDHLRKRRPPQDWVRLCKLQDVPAEELA